MSKTEARKNDTMRLTVLQAIKDMHKAFKEVRTGGPYPVEERIGDEEMEENNG